jgi:hypothetical protein
MVRNATYQRSRRDAAELVHARPPSQWTPEDVERVHILQVLRGTNWEIGGPNGAAVRPDLRRIALLYRLEKLDIPRQSL